MIALVSHSAPAWKQVPSPLTTVSHTRESAQVRAKPSSSSFLLLLLLFPSSLSRMRFVVVVVVTRAISHHQTDGYVSTRRHHSLSQLFSFFPAAVGRSRCQKSEGVVINNRARARLPFRCKPVGSALPGFLFHLCVLLSSLYEI